MALNLQHAHTISAKDLRKTVARLAEENPRKLMNLFLLERARRIKAEKLSEIDEITESLLNKRGWRRAVLEEGFQSVRHGEQFAIFFMDLDNVKHVDDAFGHHIGTKYIQLFGEVMETVLRPEDAKAHPQGDEYLALLPRITKEEAEKYRELLLLEFTKRIAVLTPRHDLYEASRSVRIGPSIGIAHKCWTKEERQEILNGTRIETIEKVKEAMKKIVNESDVDLYRVKRERKGGKNRKISSFKKFQTITMAKSMKLVYITTSPIAYIRKAVKR